MDMTICMVWIWFDINTYIFDVFSWIRNQQNKKLDGYISLAWGPEESEFSAKQNRSIICIFLFWGQLRTFSEQTQVHKTNMSTQTQIFRLTTNIWGKANYNVSVYLNVYVNGT